MGLRSKLGVEHVGMFFFAVFYLMAGVLNFVVLGLYGLGLFHVAIVAVLSFVTSFGLYRLRNWSLWLVSGLFFIASTYVAYMLSFSINSYYAEPQAGNLFAMLVWIIYLLLTWLATLYVAARRRYLK